MKNEKEKIYNDIITQICIYLHCFEYPPDPPFGEDIIKIRKEEALKRFKNDSFFHKKVMSLNSAIIMIIEPLTKTLT